MTTEPANPLWRLMLRREVVGNAVRVSFFVGLCLNAINQGHYIWQGGEVDWAKGLLNFGVPYLVASYSGAKALLAKGL